MKSIINDSIKTEVVDRIKNLSESDKAQWGKMNAHQMLCHCADQIRMALGEKETIFVGNGVTKHIVKRLVLFGMPAPKGKVETVKELKQGVGGTKPVEFESDKKTLVEYINKFDNEYPQNKNIAHPAFGEMNKVEWGKLIFTHLDHHLKQFGR